MNSAPTAAIASAPYCTTVRLSATRTFLARFRIESCASSTFGCSRLSKQVATLDVENDILEPDTAVHPEGSRLRVVPSAVLHAAKYTTCARKVHIGMRGEVAQEYARPRRMTTLFAPAWHTGDDVLVHPAGAVERKCRELRRAVSFALARQIANRMYP